MRIETPKSKKRSYAVLWSVDGATGPGRLEVVHETLELHGRDRRLSIPLAELTGALIARNNGDRLRGLLARPVLRLNPYATPDRDIFICSAATPPGGGVHGMCGVNAARAALRSRLG